MDPATPKPGETGTPKAPENVTPTPAPVQGNADETAVEKLRKEKEQAEMRANQLANQLKAKEDAEAAAKARELEEQNEYKTLFEQEKAKREAIESERETETKRKELESAKTEVLGEYSDDVKATATELGIELASVDEDAKATFKEKLDKIQARVSSSGKVTPSNPGKQTSQPQLSGDELKVALKDPSSFEQIVSQRPGIAAMMTAKRN